MTYRGITLIELLIAIAILLAIGAIVTPIMVRTLDERRFESAAEQIELHLLLARSYAQRTGTPVVVQYHPDSHRIAAQRFIQSFTLGAVPQNRTSATQGATSRDTESVDGFDVGDDDSAIVEAWAERRLPRGINLSDQRPLPRINSEQQPPQGELRESSSTENEPIQVAVFLPDGSAMFARTLWITDSHNRHGRIRISAWTGTARYERLPDRTDALPPADVEEDELMHDPFDGFGG
jgi:type II secretory pathway pseudopilin PulG